MSTATQTATPASPRLRTVASVRKIADPVKRLRAAQDLVAAAESAADAQRTIRDNAAVALRHVAGWKQVDVLRLLGFSRALYVRIEKRALSPLPAFEDPKAAALAAQEAVARYEALVREARAVRDEVADDMLNGRLRAPDGTMYRNAHVARITGLTTARVTQMRYGRR